MVPLAADMSLCYLQLYRELQTFQNVDRPVADAALAVLLRHTAFLRPETVVLSLALGAVNADQWQALATAPFSKLEVVESEDAELCLESHTRLADLVTYASWLLFHLLQLNPNPDWNNPSVYGRMMRDTEGSETSCVIST